MALVLRHARNGRSRHARPHLARIDGRTSIPIRTHRTIDNGRMTSNASRANFARTGAAIIERQIGIVVVRDSLAIAIANLEKTIVVCLRRNWRVFRGEVYAANAIRAARTLTAFIVCSGTIRGDVTTDALCHVIADERITCAADSAIRALRQSWIGGHTRGADIVRTRIEVVRKIRVIVFVDNDTIAITNGNFAVSSHLRGNLGIYGGKRNFARPRIARMRLAGIVRATVRRHETFDTSAFIVTHRAVVCRAARADGNRRIGGHIIDAFVGRTVVHVIDWHTDGAAAAAATTAGGPTTFTACATTTIANL